MRNHIDLLTVQAFGGKILMTRGKEESHMWKTVRESKFSQLEENILLDPSAHSAMKGEAKQKQKQKQKNERLKRTLQSKFCYKPQTLS